MQGAISIFLSSSSSKKMLLGISWYRQFKQTNGTIRNQYQVRPAEGGGKIGWDGTREAGTSKITWKVSVKFECFR